MSFDLKLVDNDLDLNTDGTLQTIRDNSKLVQDILKAILTEQGENPFHRWYGGVISLRLIGNVLDANQGATEAERAIQDTLATLVALQREQARVQYVSPGETLATLKSVDVLRDDTDPRKWQVTVAVITRALTVVEVTFGLRL
jgi:hypothetical protein